MTLESDSVVEELHSSQRLVLEGLARGRSTQELLEDVCLQGERFVGPETRCALLFHRNGHLFRGAAPSMPPEFLDVMDGKRVKAELIESFEPNRTNVFLNVQTDSGILHDRDVACRFEIEAVWTFPVIDRRDGSIIGQLAVHRPSGSQPTDEQHALLCRLADLSALITRRHLLERRVAFEQARFAHTLDSTNTGVFEWNPESGEVLLSPRARVALGLEQHSDGAGHVGWLGRQSIHPDDLGAAEKAIEDHFASGQSFFHAEFRVRSSTGEWRWIQERGRTIRRNAEGAPTLVLGTLQDITEAKQVEAQLQRLQRLESLGEIASGIGHDFNNLLAGVRGAVELALLDVSEADTDVVEDLTLALAAVDRGRALTRQLITLASKEPERLSEPIELHDLIDETVRFDLLGSEMRPIFELALSVCRVRASEVKIRQLISTVVRNAREACESGTLFVTLDNHESQSREVEPGHYVRLAFSDDGPGIDPEVLPRVFDPYFTTKTQGSGLGLSTAYATARGMGGTITVTSEPGEGATFTVLLPAIYDEDRSPDIE